MALEICKSSSEVVSCVPFFKLASPSFVKEIRKEDHGTDNQEHSPVKKTKNPSSLRLDGPGRYISPLPRKFQSF